ncbi:MAG TPA: ROK family protein [Ktedonobacterales bacterium]|jgi:fructokinase
MRQVWGGIEGGGTKFNCLLGTGPDAILAERTLPTTSPGETLGAVARFFEEHVGSESGQGLAGLGIACFGPIDLNPRSPTYGSVTTTPKPGWSGAEVVGFFRGRFGVPIGWDTDVNGAALGELRWGAGRGLDSLVYITVGTGIGGGAIVGGRPLHGLLHPEMGHIPVTPAIQAAGPGVCPYHGGWCLEGVASGPALARRAGRPAPTIPADDPIWEDEARALGFAAATIALTLSPERIIFGGGVLKQEQLYPRIRHHCLAALNGYLRVPAITDHIDTYIAAPGLGDRAGALGALALGIDAARP